MGLLVLPGDLGKDPRGCQPRLPWGATPARGTHGGAQHLPGGGGGGAASVGQGDLSGGSVPAVHSSHSQPAACSHRAGEGWGGGVLTAPAPQLCGGGMRAEERRGESSGCTGTPWVWLVPLALQGPSGIGCVRDAALSGGQGVPVPSWDLGQATRAEQCCSHDTPGCPDTDPSIAGAARNLCKIHCPSRRPRWCHCGCPHRE